jgi:CMP-N-acetylneuraminic acid synthetase
MPRGKVSDEQTTAEMLTEFLKLYKKINKELDYVCILYPTSVFVTRKEIEIANMNHGDDAIITFCKYPYPSERAFQIENGLMKMICPETMFNDLKRFEMQYYDVGQMYFLKVKSFSEQKKIFMDNIYPIIIDAVDINDESDWKKAEAFYKSIRK